MPARPSKRSNARWWGAWGLSRLAVVFLAFLHQWTQGDPKYYFQQLSEQGVGALGEYPLAAVWPLRAAWMLSADSVGLFITLFSLLCLLFDAAFFFSLTRMRPTPPPAAMWLWIAMGLLLPEVLIWRYDVIPGALVGIAAIFVGRHRAQVLLAIAAMMKLWPFALVPMLVRGLRNAATWVAAAVFSATVAGIALLTLSMGGVERLLSPLGYQGARGLQLESVAATPLVLGAMLNSGAYEVQYAASKSFEISGPLDAPMQLISTVLMAACAALVLLWLYQALVRGPLPHSLVVAWMVLILAVLLLANKVLSPQYLLWVAPVVAVGLALRPTLGWTRWTALVLLLCAALTKVVYPVAYDQIDHVPFDGALGATALVVRNVLLVVLMILAAGWVRYETRVSKQGLNSV